ncbi:MAG: ABC transporter substrate-binding protein [Hyphomicrobiales bacterium]|nr:ABC transporter substrate-binding protein [Hyphomicrobiales bacterium]
MTKKPTSTASRRRFLAGAAATTGLVAASSFVPTRFAIGAKAPIKVGILLPYSGTYAMLGNSITDALKLRIAEAGGKLGGRDVDWVAIDSEWTPAKAPIKSQQLVNKEKVDFVVGPVHSGIAMGMSTVLRPRKTPIWIIPNAGNDLLTGKLCAPHVFRTSFSNWQSAHVGGKLMADDGIKTCVNITWKYAAGEQMMAAGKAAFEAAGGKVIEEIWVPFPDVEFQAFLSKIAALKPDAVFSFYSGGGAIKFVKDYAAAGLKESIPLYGPGFLTEGVIKAQGDAAEGIKTALHYADGLNTPADNKFRAAYQKAYGRGPNVFSVQGYDTGSLLLQAAAAVGGDIGATANVIEAMESATFADSPRGPWKMSAAHNPVQDIYIREAKGGQNLSIGVGAKQLEDPATGCKTG